MHLPLCNYLLQELDERPLPVPYYKHQPKRKQMTFLVAQRQIDTDTIEILWECTSEEQAQDAADLVNDRLAYYGIPGDYYAYVY